MPKRPEDGSGSSENGLIHRAIVSPIGLLWTEHRSFGRAELVLGDLVILDKPKPNNKRFRRMLEAGNYTLSC